MMRARTSENERADRRADVRVPALDLEVPGLLSVATFALG
jgi:hypothetical protein